MGAQSQSMTVVPSARRAVVLVGCGNIGFRHLQAITASSMPLHVAVVEPDGRVHDRISAHVAAASGTPHTFELLSNVPTDGRPIDLAVIATAADVRRSIVEQLLGDHAVGAMILEKVLFQTVGDLDAVQEQLSDRAVAAYVNCGRRTFLGYRSLARELAIHGPVDVTVRGNRLGLASNAVHFFDLAEFLNGSQLQTVDATELSPCRTAGKRAGTVEVFGTIVGDLANGGRVRATSHDADPMAIAVELTYGATSTVIDELGRTRTDGSEQPRSFDAKHVSEATEVYEQALGSGACVLTPFADSARHHRLYLRALRDHLGLSNTDDVPCPIS